MAFTPNDFFDWWFTYQFPSKEDSDGPHLKAQELIEEKGANINIGMMRLNIGGIYIIFVGGRNNVPSDVRKVLEESLLSGTKTTLSGELVVACGVEMGRLYPEVLAREGGVRKDATYKKKYI